MDCHVKILEINLAESSCRLLDPTLLNQGGYANVSPKIHLAKPAFDAELKTAKLECLVNIGIVGVVDVADQADTTDPVFILDTAFAGTFEICESDGRRFESDAEFRKNLSERLANRIYPLQRSHALETMRLMGVHDASLPWHLDLSSLTVTET